MLTLVFVALFSAQALARPSTNDYPIESHIVGGIPAKEGQFPFMVALREMDSEKFFCGGALLSDRYILTARHCVQLYINRPNLLGIGVGSVDLASQKIYKADKIITHPPSNDSPLFNDIALVRVSSPIPLGGNVQTILPYPNNDQLEGKMVTAMGWGFIATNGPHSTKLLYLNERPIISNDVCKKLVERSGPVGPGNICTKGEMNHGICFGDSGSPLVHKAADGKTYVVGLTVWGLSHFQGHPDVFTRVSHYINWIKENMK